MVDFALTEAQLELRDRARAFALREVLPVAFSADERDELPLELIHKAHDAGLLNLEIPARYGGRGLGLLDQVLVVEELAAACPGLATSLFDNSLGVEPLLLSTNEGVRERYLPEIVKGSKLISFATSEPTMGSDVAGIRCLARREGDGYVLSGTKYWVTNGGVADYFTIFATTEPKSRHEGLCAFVVERGWPGVSVGLPIPKLGQRGSNTVGLKLDNVRVPSQNVLAPPGQGFVLAMRTFSRTRPAIGAFATGAARSALEFARDYVGRRRAFGQKIGDFEGVQFKLADMYQKVETARLLTWWAASEGDRGADPTVPASIAKLYSSEAALEVANDALQLLGGYGYTRFFPVEKLLRDVRLFSIYEGTSEVQRTVLARHVTSTYEPTMPSLEDLPVWTGDGVEDELGSEALDQPLWRCRTCGYVHRGGEPPGECPYCFFPKTAFKRIGR